MTTFKFRLATLLKLRESERRQRQIELGQALEAEQIVLGKAAEVAAEISATRDRLRAAAAPGAVPVDAILELQRYVLQLKGQSLRIHEQLTRVRSEVEKRRQVLTEADRQVRMLEKLRDKQAAAFQSETERREQLTLDEIAQAKPSNATMKPGFQRT